METLKLLYIAMGPGIALAVYLYYSDKWEPEPKSLVLKSFLLGGLACFPTSYFEGVFQDVFSLDRIWSEHYRYLWWQKVFYAFIGVALAEELCKFLFLKAFICDDRQLNEPFDGIVYGGMLGCGFATIENISYVLTHGQEVGIVRMITAVPGHVFDGVILGYFMGRAKFSLTPNKHWFTGLSLVVCLHGIYDTAILAHQVWSTYLIFAIVFLGIYLGLKAKRELEKHSTVIEFSKAEYARDSKSKSFLLLKDIRDLLAEGKLYPEDSLIEKKSGKTKTVKEIFSSKLIAKYRALPKSSPQGQPLRLLLLFYGLTMGLYFYFWFFRNYRDFASYKKLKINPEFRVLILFALSIIPYFIYGVILGTLGKNEVGPVITVSFNLCMAGVESTFIFFQLRMIKKFLKRKMKNTFPLVTISLAYFVVNGWGNVLQPNAPYYLPMEFILILLQGSVLAMVQRDLNRYWQIERDESEGSL